MRILVMMWLAIVCFGCGSRTLSVGGSGGGTATNSASGSTSSTGDGAGGAGGSAAADGGGAVLRYETSPYALKPGDELRYFCFSFHMPATATTVTRIAPQYGAATHHIVVWQALAPEPEGQFDCPELSKDTWFPTYVGGASQSALDVPAGKGIMFPPGQQVVIQLHLLNTTSADVTDTAALELTTTTELVTPAGAYGLDNRTIDLPAHSTGDAVSMNCTATRNMEVFGAFAHLHKLGTRVDLAVDGAPFYDAPWAYDNQPVVPTAGTIKAGQTMTLGCTYDNPGAADVLYGTSVDDEMCAFVLYYSPWAGYGGCVNGVTQ